MELIICFSPKALTLQDQDALRTAGQGATATQCLILKLQVPNASWNVYKEPEKGSRSSIPCLAYCNFTGEKKETQRN